MSQPAVYKTVTLTVTTLVNLLAALQAIDSSIGAGGTSASYREVNLQADPGNAGTNNVLVGDDQLSVTRIGFVLTPGASRTYGTGGTSGSGGAPVANIWLLAAAGTPKLNVELLM